MRIRVQRLNAAATLPRYMTAGAAGMDLTACVDQSMQLQPGERALVPTGLAIELPTGYEGQVRPRSGLAHRHGVTVLNAPGTIDADYRGEVKVILINLGQEPVEIEAGTRVAQLVVAPVAHAAVDEAVVLGDTARGEGGFGHTDDALPARGQGR